MTRDKVNCGVRKKICSRQTDFVQTQPEVWGLRFREDGFGGFWQDALGALIRKKDDGASIANV